VAPVVRGEENLPDPLAPKARPLLFVGNHTRFGLYDLPFLVCELYLRGLKARRRRRWPPLHVRRPWCVTAAMVMSTQCILMHALSRRASLSPAVHACLAVTVQGILRRRPASAPALRVSAEWQAQHE